jgi:hypothetical protein
MRAPWAAGHALACGMASCAAERSSLRSKFSPPPWSPPPPPTHTRARTVLCHRERGRALCAVQRALLVCWVPAGGAGAGRCALTRALCRWQAALAAGAGAWVSVGWDVSAASQSSHGTACMRVWPDLCQQQHPSTRRASRPPTDTQQHRQRQELALFRNGSTSFQGAGSGNAKQTEGDVGDLTGARVVTTVIVNGAPQTAIEVVEGVRKFRCVRGWGACAARVAACSWLLPLARTLKACLRALSGHCWVTPTPTATLQHNCANTHSYTYTHTHTHARARATGLARRWRRRSRSGWCGRSTRRSQRCGARRRPWMTCLPRTHPR